MLLPLFYGFFVRIIFLQISNALFGYKKGTQLLIKCLLVTPEGFEPSTLRAEI